MIIVQKSTHSQAEGGYDEFLQRMEGWLRENLLGFVCFAGFIIVVQILMCAEHATMVYVERSRSKRDANRKDDRGFLPFVLVWLMFPLNPRTVPIDGFVDPDAAAPQTSNPVGKDAGANRARAATAATGKAAGTVLRRRRTYVL